MFTQKFQAWVRRWAERAVSVFRDSPVTPNMLTLFGLVITAVGAALVAGGQLLAGGIVLAFAGFFDIFDGALARAAGKVYRYGAFLDSTVDRYCEAVVYLGILIYFLDHHDGLRPILVLVALSGSFLVSYVRARAQSLGFTCDGGILARPERVVIICAGLILESLPILVRFQPLTIALLALAVGTNFTAVQRIWLVWQQNRAELRAQRASHEAGSAEEAVRPTIPPKNGAPPERPMRAAMRRFFESLGKT